MSSFRNSFGNSFGRSGGRLFLFGLAAVGLFRFAFFLLSPRVDFFDPSPDGKSFVYSYRRVITDLYLMDGLRP